MGSEPPQRPLAPDAPAWLKGFSERLEAYAVPATSLVLVIDERGLIAAEREAVRALIVERVVKRFCVERCVLLGVELTQYPPWRLGMRTAEEQAEVARLLAAGGGLGPSIETADNLLQLNRCYAERVLYIGDGRTDAEWAGGLGPTLSGLLRWGAERGRAAGDAVPIGKNLTAESAEVIRAFVDGAGGFCPKCEDLGIRLRAPAVDWGPSEKIEPDAGFADRLANYELGDRETVVLCVDLRGLEDSACERVLKLVREKLVERLGAKTVGWVLVRQGISRFPADGRPLKPLAEPSGVLGKALDCGTAPFVRKSSLRWGLGYGLSLANGAPASRGDRKVILYVGSGLYPGPRDASNLTLNNYQRIVFDAVTTRRDLSDTSRAFLEELTGMSDGTCVGCERP